MLAETLPEEDLVALVGSRLCHDLISPLGAIGNGVELLTMTTGTPSPELQLIAESVAAANSRIKFFRLAFGRSGEQRIGKPEIATLMTQFSQGNRLRIDWRAEGDFARQMVKLACLAVLCLEPAMPRGGEITIDSDAPDGSGTWMIRGTTLRVKEDPSLWANLDGMQSEVSPAQVQFALLPREARAMGRTLAWDIGETSVSITY
ncbi:histidine phosphotransferase family protein [Paenirhodobacter sp.]|uniref:histidine phosphotransferase family protein n=1 Tax=Paenirhodobacter sp. TaxID=1965326 RepID=UPI003B3E986F